MPCRDGGPTPDQERAMATRDAKAQQKKIDKLTADLCEARGIIAGFVKDSLTVDDFKMTAKWKKHLNDHLKHRRVDREHAIDDWSTALKKADNDEVAQECLEAMAAVVAVTSDEDLLRTTLF